MLVMPQCSACSAGASSPGPELWQEIRPKLAACQSKDTSETLNIAQEAAATACTNWYLQVPLQMMGCLGVRPAPRTNPQAVPVTTIESETYEVEYRWCPTRQTGRNRHQAGWRLYNPVVARHQAVLIGGS
jgi:hypothetical protein